MEETKKESKFEKEINALRIVGFVNIRGKNEVIIYFKRLFGGRWINGWARYSGRFTKQSMETKEIKEFMIAKGQIGY